MIIVPTHRASTDSLALSSRNAYLSPEEREFAGTLYAALQLAQRTWGKGESSVEEVIGQAQLYVQQRAVDAEEKGVKLRLDYISLTDPETFEPVDWVQNNEPGRTAILAGAVFVGTTRLIDNLICGDASTIISA